MVKQTDLMNRIGGDLATTMGTTRSGLPSGIMPGWAATPAGRNARVGRLKGAAEIAIDRCMPNPDQPRTEFDPDAIGGWRPASPGTDRLPRLPSATPRPS